MTDAHLSRQLEAYLAVRQALGLDVRAEAVLLREFLEYAAARDSEGTVRAQTAVDWACAASARRGISGQARRLSVARKFLGFARADRPEIEVPAASILAVPKRPRPYLFTEEEIGKLLDAASALQPRYSLRPASYRALLGLLACTGLRVSEAVGLVLQHVHIHEDPAWLEIRDTKFGKSRVVVLHPTTAEMLRVYARERARRAYDGLSDVLFTTEAGKPLDLSTLQRTFRRMTDRLGFKPVGAERRPSLHSFRHTFAVRRLATWIREGADVRALLPHLATYLGHVRPSSSYWYLTATPELLEEASDLFERYRLGGDQ